MNSYQNFNIIRLIRYETIRHSFVNSRINSIFRITIFSLIAVNASEVLAKNVVNKNVPTQNSNGSLYIPPVLAKFGDSWMTRERAEEMLAPLGAKFVDFSKCGYNDGSCIYITAVKRNDNVFRYEILDKVCYKNPQNTKPNLGIQSDQRTIQKSISAKTQINKESSSTSKDSTEPPKDFCLSVKRVVSRVKQDNMVAISPDGHLFRFTHVFQERGNNEWKDVETLSFANWITGFITPTGGEDVGWSYEIYDEKGDLAGSNSESVNQIAGSSDGSTTDYQRCTARKDTMKSTNLEMMIGGFWDICKLVEPDKFTLGDAIVPASLEWNGGICQGFENMRKRYLEQIQNEFMEDCLANPDWVLSDNNLNFTVIEYAELIQFKPPGEINTSPSVCSSYTVKDVHVDMGDGRVCTADVRMECTSNVAGGCYCSPDSIAGDLVCNGPG